MSGRVPRFLLIGFLILALVVVTLVGCEPTPTDIPVVTRLIEVRDADTGQAIVGADIAIEPLNLSSKRHATTDENGQVTISVDAGEEEGVKLTIRAEGYQDLVLRTNLDSLPGVIYLDLSAAAATLVVTASPDTIPVPTTLAPPPTSTASPPTLTPAPTFTPTPTTPPPPPPSTYTPTPPPIPLSIRDLWATGAVCEVGSLWSADLWVQPEGGDGTYTYYIDGNWQAGPTTEGVTIHIPRNTCIAIVGTLTVESGGQIESREFYIDVPDCCE